MNYRSQKLRGPRPNQKWFLGQYLRAYPIGLVVATILAFILGIISASIAALVGPSLQVLMADNPETPLKIADLFGNKLGAFVRLFVETDSIQARDLLLKLPVLLLILAVVKSLVTLSQWFLWERAGELVSRDVRSDLMSKYVYFNPINRQRKTEREWEASFSSIISTDVKLLREYLVHVYGGFPREFLQIIFLSITLFVCSPKLFVIFFVGVAPAFFLISKLGKKLRRKAKKALESYAELTELLQQRLLGIETIKHYKTELLEIRKMEATNQGLFRRFLRATKVKAETSPMLEGTAIFSMMIVLIVALKDIQSGHATGSTQVSFFSALVLLSQAAAKMGKYFNSSREGAAAIDRIKAINLFFNENIKKDIHIEVKRTDESHEKKTRLICQNVVVRYPDQEQPALNNFSFCFHSGRIYCLTGPSGAGKSTLFKTLLGITKPCQGKVTLEIPSNFHTNSHEIGYMPQLVQLAPDSISHNVAYPHQNPAENLIIDSLKQVEFFSDMEKLPDKLDTKVGIGGVGLSGGQMQRILLARLFFHRYPVILFDEGTSALDPEIEKTIFSSLRQFAKDGAIIIMIAHRLTAVEYAHEKLVLKNGFLI